MSNGKRASTSQWRATRALILAANQTCGICGETIDTSLSGLHPDGPTIDHIVPAINGGTDDWSNLQPAHRRCNLSKGSSRQSGPLAW